MNDRFFEKIKIPRAVGRRGESLITMFYKITFSFSD